MERIEPIDGIRLSPGWILHRPWAFIVGLLAVGIACALLYGAFAGTWGALGCRSCGSDLAGLLGIGLIISGSGSILASLPARYFPLPGSPLP